MRPAYVEHDAAARNRDDETHAAGGIEMDFDKTHVQNSGDQLSSAAEGECVEDDGGLHRAGRPRVGDEHEHGGGHAEADEAEGSCEQ